MAQKTRQAYQYEAPVTPSKWTGEEQRFSLRVKAALEDLYQKFGRLSSNPAADSEKLGGKAPEYYVQPVNMLDNSDFRKPVNQRGNTEITGDWNYGIDRWLASTKYEQNPNGSILITDNGLSMGYWTDMMQLIPFEQLKSKTLTFAVCTENGVYAYTMTLPESVPPVGGGAMYFGDGIWNDIIVMETIKYDSNDSVLFRFRNAQTTNQLVYWAALYEGSYTAETLPPYIPKGYAVELAECQRYYFGASQANAGLCWTGYSQSTTEARFSIPIGVQMRAIPTISFGDLSMLRIYNNGNSVIPTSIVGVSLTPNGVVVRLNANGLAEAYLCGLKVNTTFSISADL